MLSFLSLKSDRNGGQNYENETNLSNTLIKCRNCYVMHNTLTFLRYAHPMTHIPTAGTDAWATSIHLIVKEKQNPKKSMKSSIMLMNQENNRDESVLLLFNSIPKEGAVCLD